MNKLYLTHEQMAQRILELRPDSNRSKCAVPFWRR